MYAGIGPTGGGNARRVGLQRAQGGFDRLLHRGRAILPLPARKRATVIFQPERITWHGRRHSAPPRR